MKISRIRVETSRQLPDGIDVVRLEQRGETVLLVREGPVHSGITDGLTAHLQHMMWRHGYCAQQDAVSVTRHTI